MQFWESTIRRNGIAHLQVGDRPSRVRDRTGGAQVVLRLFTNPANALLPDTKKPQTPLSPPPSQRVFPQASRCDMFPLPLLFRWPSFPFPFPCHFVGSSGIWGVWGTWRFRGCFEGFQGRLVLRRLTILVWLHVTRTTVSEPPCLKHPTVPRTTFPWTIPPKSTPAKTTLPVAAIPWTAVHFFWFVAPLDRPPLDPPSPHRGKSRFCWPSPLVCPLTVVAPRENLGRRPTKRETSRDKAKTLGAAPGPASSGQYSLGRPLPDHGQRSPGPPFPTPFLVFCFVGAAPRWVRRD